MDFPEQDFINPGYNEINSCDEDLSQMLLDENEYDRGPDFLTLFETPTHFSEGDLTTDNDKSPKSSKKTRNLICLSNEARKFKKNLYAIFLGKFPKRYVHVLHDQVCNQIGLPPMSRAEKRSIGIYFEHFSPYSAQILEAIKRVLPQRPEIIHQITHM